MSCIGRAVVALAATAALAGCAPGVNTYSEPPGLPVTNIQGKGVNVPGHQWVDTPNGTCSIVFSGTLVGLTIDASNQHVLNHVTPGKKWVQYYTPLIAPLLLGSEEHKWQAGVMIVPANSANIPEATYPIRAGGALCNNGAVFELETAQYIAMQIRYNEQRARYDRQMQQVAALYRSKYQFKVESTAVIIPVKGLDWVQNMNLDRFWDSCYVDEQGQMQFVADIDGRQLYRYTTPDGGGTECDNETLFHFSDPTTPWLTFFW